MLAGYIELASVTMFVGCVLLWHRQKAARVEVAERRRCSPENVTAQLRQRRRASFRGFDAAGSEAASWLDQGQIADQERIEQHDFAQDGEALEETVP